MSTNISEKLAIDGGEPCVVDKPDGYGHGPMEIGEEEIELVTQVLRTKKLFRFLGDSATMPTAQFEALFREKTQVPLALAVNSGTSALISALVGLGVSQGDEVIVPGYTYIATAAAVLAVGAIPVIAEIDDSLTLDPDDVEKKITDRTTTIIPVHMRGTPCRMDRIMAVAKKHNLKVLEDCAQANGAAFKGKPVGSIGDAGAFSLQHFKIITAGEGGVVTTHDQTVHDRAACYHDSAYTFWMERQDKLSIKPFLGQNYRLSEVHGAIALAQLRKRDAILGRMRAIKKKLLPVVAAQPDVTLQDVPCPEGDAAVSLVFFGRDQEHARRFAEALRAEGMSAGTLYDKTIPDRHIYYHWDYIMQKRSPDRNGRPWTDPQFGCRVDYSRDMCPRSIAILERCVVLPLTQRMSDAHVDSCARAIERVGAALA